MNIRSVRDARRIVLSSVLSLSGSSALGIACSSTTSNTSSPAVVQPTVDAGNCTDECCQIPAPGTTCSADAGTTCGYAVTCSEGLRLTRSIVCQAGTWQSVEDCPPSGGFDDNGCPSAQPSNGSPCANADGGIPPSCTYTKACGSMACNDAGVCAPVTESANASCVMGTWMTTALGSC